jgi:hypothetical protein
MPHYPIKDVKQLIRLDQIHINPNALATALNDFGWGPAEIKKCLLKLNSRPHRIDRDKNHFHKSEPHWHIPNTVMDYYKAKKIMQGSDIYTHFYIHPQSGKLVVSSFKEL